MLSKRHFDGKSPSKDIVSTSTVHHIRQALVLLYDKLSRIYENYTSDSFDTLCNTVANVYSRKFLIATPPMIQKSVKIQKDDKTEEFYEYQNKEREEEDDEFE